MVRRLGFGAGIVVGVCAALGGVALLQLGGDVHAQAQASGGNPASKVLLDNDRVNVVRSVATAETVEKPHAHGPDQNYVTIQLTPGDLEVTVGDQPTIHGSQGSVYWLPGTQTHTVNNRSKTPIEVIVVRLKDPVKK